MPLASVLQHPFFDDPLWQQYRTLILLWIAVIVVPFVTYQLTTFLFYRTARSSRPLKVPPTVPYWVPGIFNGVGLFFGPAAYFGKLINKYGDLSPFVVKAGPLSFLVLRDANHVKKIFQSPQQMTPRALQVRVFEKVMGSPKPALLLYGGIGEESEQVSHAHLTVPRLYLSGAPLAPLADVYIQSFRRNLSNKMFQTKSWTEIEDLWGFFQNEITRATIETIFGEAILKQYPRLVRDFWEFDSNVESLMRGLPRFMMPVAAYAARDRLHENLKKWLQSAHGGEDFAKVGDKDPVWDKLMGSKFLQARDTVFAKIPTLDYQARAAEALAIMQGSNSNTMPSTFWYIVETLRNPALAKHLTKELGKHCNPASDLFDIAAITALPIIQSMHAEIGRLRMATSAIRTNEVHNFKLDDKWLIPKGMSVIIFSHDLAQNTELWEKARPQTAQRPLDEFWAERFLIPDKPTTQGRKKTTIPEEKIGAGRFSMEGVDALHTTFGGGQHLCPGRHLAQAVQAGTLAVLLCEYDVQLSDPDDVELILPSVTQLAYGNVKPLDKIRVRIRKRESKASCIQNA